MDGEHHVSAHVDRYEQTKNMNKNSPLTPLYKESSNL